MTAADRPSVTDDARAEWEHYCHDYDVHPSDLTRLAPGVLRRLARAAAEWATGRAETTTATDEDAPPGEVLIDDTDWVPWRDLPRYAAKQKRTAEDAQREAKMHYLAREELEGLLATARTRPTETEWAVRGQHTGSITPQHSKRHAEAIANALPYYSVVRREVTSWTEADQ